MKKVQSWRGRQGAEIYWERVRVGKGGRSKTGRMKVKAQQELRSSHPKPSVLWCRLHACVCVSALYVHTCIITDICEKLVIVSGNPGGFHDSSTGMRGYPDLLTMALRDAFKLHTHIFCKCVCVCSDKLYPLDTCSDNSTLTSLLFKCYQHYNSLYCL